MIEAFQFEFMRHALLAAILVSICCGIIGTLVVVNRLVFLAGGIAHAAYGGIGLAFFFGLPYMVGTLGFSLLAAFTMAIVTLRAKHRADTMVGVLWAVGMSIGIILLDLTPGYNMDLMSFLFGSILTVPASDLWQMTAMVVLIAFAVSFYYNDLLAMSYDEEFAQIRQVPVRFLYFLLLGMIALSVVMIIRIVGLILVIALLTIPTYIAEKFAVSLRTMMIMSSLLSAVFTITGLWASYLLNLTSGATIIMVAAAGFLVAELAQRLIGKRFGAAQDST
jgi:zinc transport system permease protein